MFLLGQQKPFRFSEATTVPIRHLNAGFPLYADVSFYIDLASVYGEKEFHIKFEWQRKFYGSDVKVSFLTFKRESYISRVMKLTTTKI
jgi:hypothetical protein